MELTIYLDVNGADSISGRRMELTIYLDVDGADNITGRRMDLEVVFTALAFILSIVL